MKWNFFQPKRKISATTIYAAVKNGVLSETSAKKNFRRRGKPYYKSRSRFSTIHPDFTIHDRTKDANDRISIGHWEGDTIVGKGKTSAIVTLVDRKSRKLITKKVSPANSENVKNAIIERLKNEKVKSITLDNGSEFAKFREFGKELNVPIYFCDPRSPYQRGTNENTNGILRFFFPKDVDFSTVSDEEISRVTALINSRPKKVLGLKTPDEVFESEDEKELSG